jgi:hypothetical protein
MSLNPKGYGSNTVTSPKLDPDELLYTKGLQSFHGVHRAHSGTTLIEIAPNWLFRWLQYAKWTFFCLTYLLIGGTRPQGDTPLDPNWDTIVEALPGEGDTLRVQGNFELEVQSVHLGVVFAVPIASLTDAPAECEMVTASSLSVSFYDYWSDEDASLLVWSGEHQGNINCTKDTVYFDYFIDLSGDSNGAELGVSAGNFNRTDVSSPPVRDMVPERALSYVPDRREFNQLHTVNYYTTIGISMELTIYECTLFEEESGGVGVGVGVPCFSDVRDRIDFGEVDLTASCRRFFLEAQIIMSFITLLLICLFAIAWFTLQGFYGVGLRGIFRYLESTLFVCMLAFATSYTIGQTLSIAGFTLLGLFLEICQGFALFFFSLVLISLGYRRSRSGHGHGGISTTPHANSPLKSRTSPATPGAHTCDSTNTPVELACEGSSSVSLQMSSEEEKSSTAAGNYTTCAQLSFDPVRAKEDKATDDINSDANNEDDAANPSPEVMSDSRVHDLDERLSSAPSLQLLPSITTTTNTGTTTASGSLQQRIPSSSRATVIRGHSVSTDSGGRSVGAAATEKRYLSAEGGVESASSSRGVRTETLLGTSLDGHLVFVDWTFWGLVPLTFGVIIARTLAASGVFVRYFTRQDFDAVGPATTLAMTAWFCALAWLTWLRIRKLPYMHHRFQYLFFSAVLEFLFFITPVLILEWAAQANLKGNSYPRTFTSTAVSLVWTWQIVGFGVWMLPSSSINTLSDLEDDEGSGGKGQSSFQEWPSDNYETMDDSEIAQGTTSPFPRRLRFPHLPRALRLGKKKIGVNKKRFWVLQEDDHHLLLQRGVDKGTTARLFSEGSCSRSTDTGTTRLGSLFPSVLSDLRDATVHTFQSVNRAVANRSLSMLMDDTFEERHNGTIRRKGFVTWTSHHEDSSNTVDDSALLLRTDPVKPPRPPPPREDFLFALQKAFQLFNLSYQIYYNPSYIPDGRLFLLISSSSRTSLCHYHETIALIFL